jgi:DUF971 family protein
MAMSAMATDVFSVKRHPVEIRLKRDEKILEVDFDDGAKFRLPAEMLRVESPSAEVQGHNGEKRIIGGRRHVGITGVEPVGNYAVRLVFDDGHDSGLYAWGYLYELGATYPDRWQHYLERVAKLGLPYPTPVRGKPIR